MNEQQEVVVGRINRGRVILGGILAGIVSTVFGAVLGLLMRSEFEASLKNMKPSGAVVVAHILWAFVIGIAAIWLYAAIRPRYGPGPATALKAGFALWLFAHATFSMAAGAMDLLPQKLILVSALWSLPESLLAVLVGAWIYRE